MTPEELKRVKDALPDNCTALLIGLEEQGEFVMQGTGKWNKRLAYEEGRVQHFVMGVLQLFTTKMDKLEKLGYIRSRADIMSALLYRMAEDQVDNVVDINPHILSKLEEELV